MVESEKRDRGLVAQPVVDPRLEAVNDRIAELVAEALFNHLLKRGLIPSPNKPEEPQQDASS